MKAFSLASLMLVSIFVSTAQAQVHATPLGIREAAKAEEQANKNIPPPMVQRSALNPEKIQGDADQLATLAQSIPPDIDRTMKGMFPLDLNNRLKQIEKLAKRLRQDLNHSKNQNLHGAR